MVIFLAVCAFGLCWHVVSLFQQEIAARERLDEVMRIQGRAQDERERRQRVQRQILADVAGWRPFGGFKSVEALYRAQAMAARAHEQFPSLLPEDINLAFGIFGDIEGLTQRQLTDMAILAHQEKLDGLWEPLDVLKSRVRIVQRRRWELEQEWIARK